MPTMNQRTISDSRQKALASLRHCPREHPVLTFVAVNSLFVIIIASGPRPNQSREVVHEEDGEPARGTLPQPKTSPSAALPLGGPPAVEPSKNAAPVASPQPAPIPPHVLIVRNLDQLDRELDNFVLHLQTAGDPTVMAEIRTLRRVYGTATFLREFGRLVRRPDRRPTLTKAEFEELKCLCSRWSDLERLMATAALTQETTR